MPELAEVRLTVQNINKNKDITFERVKISDITRNVINTNVGVTKFKIYAESRGKEIKINILDSESKKIKSLLIGLGMTGNLEYVSNDIFTKEKHIHLWFEGKNNLGENVFLRLRDVRRFGTWKWSESWGENRGPDPIDNFAEFKKNIYNDLSNKIFQKPLYELMLNQKYFNGIGNYLRAEIIGKSNINPFKSAVEILTGKDALILLENCSNIPKQAMILGGAELKDWSSPNQDFSQQRKNIFQNWLQYYNKGNCIVDSQGRNFWYDKKWENIKNKI